MIIGFYLVIIANLIHGAVTSTRGIKIKEWEYWVLVLCMSIAFIGGVFIGKSI